LDESVELVGILLGGGLLAEREPAFFGFVFHGYLHTRGGLAQTSYTWAIEFKDSKLGNLQRHLKVPGRRDQPVRGSRGRVLAESCPNAYASPASEMKIRT